MGATDYRPTQQTVRMRGFTLLEIMIAVTIFSVCIVAIYTSFNTASRAFNSGRRAAEEMQSIRFLVEEINRDLGSLYYETDYNARYDRLERVAAFDPDQVFRKLEEQENRIRSGTSAEEQAAIRQVGTRMNLRFLGIDNDKADSIEFARFTSVTGPAPGALGVAERVRYFLYGTDLYRQRSTVFQRMQINPNLEEDLKRAREEEDRYFDTEQRRTGVDVRSLFAGSQLVPFLTPRAKVRYYTPMPQEPPVTELLARNVLEFDLKYGFFFSNWQEAHAWNSDEKNHRTPPFRVDSAAPEFVGKVMAYESRPEDGVPSYIRIRLTLGPNPDQERRSARNRTSREQKVDTMIWLPGALEVYVPSDDVYFEEDQDDYRDQPWRYFDRETQL